MFFLFSDKIFAQFLKVLNFSIFFSIFRLKTKPTRIEYSGTSWS